jgi:hypothetical protein
MAKSTKREQVYNLCLSACVCTTVLTNLRYGFLLNRYVVPTVLGVIFYGACLSCYLTPERSSDVLDTVQAWLVSSPRGSPT